MRTLLATEHSDLWLSLEILLSEEPGAIIVGATGETEGLLALARSTRPDIVILDWDLPGRPLVDVLQEIRTMENPPSFIVLGAHMEQKEEISHAGIEAFVVKGSSPEIMLESYRKTRKQIRLVSNKSTSEKR